MTQNLNQTKKERLSNIELLRCISIFLILLVHANYLSFGMPQPEEIRNAPSLEFSRILLENISVICVDVFILISGWFGIHPKLKSIGGFIFQLLFFGFAFAVYYTYFTDKPSTLMDTFCMFRGTNFITSYLLMYLFTPVLNAFVEHCSQKELKRILFFFFLLAFTWGWLMFFTDFNVGKSALFYMGLYLLARYIRLYSTLKNLRGGVLLTIYLSIVCTTTILVWGISMSGVSDHLSIVLLNITTGYLSPMVVASSLFLLLFFNKLHFKSRFINWLAISAFSVVIIHCRLFGPASVDVGGYKDFMNTLYQKFDTPLFLLTAFFSMVGIFILSVLLDKIRILLWNKIYPLLMHINFIKKNVS